ncbi:MAG: NAD-dependent epimerase/dehydratase family protein [Terriglobia bacterium]|jgi:nucleoside-diphosphate-sugar epimerase
MPDLIQSEAELEDLLSTPSPEDIALFREVEGDLLIVGVAGKMGPSLARRAVRAAQAAGVKKRILGVSRFSSPAVERFLQQAGVETLRADLLESSSVATLPEAPNVIFMAGRKFGSTGAESLTWAMNAYLPALVAERFRHSRIVAFSSGNVYPLVPILSGGATEEIAPEPLGEYAQSVLARERLLEHFSRCHDTPVALLRLNYATDLRYGVLLDIGSKVFEGRSVDVTMGAVNVIWQGDANSVALRSLAHCQSPPLILNLTGPEALSIRAVAKRFGESFGKEPILEGQEASTALLSNAGRCHRLFGFPSVTIDQMIAWTAHWIKRGGPTLNKPTHFETRDGRF